MISASLPPILEVISLRKQFADHVVLASVDLAVPRGSIVSVLGRSGTGKSVFLKCLAGLLKPDAGEVRFENGLLDRFRSRCSYLFQGNALFDSLTALENVALPLEQTTRLGRREIALSAREALLSLGLEKFADHFPAQLSGGMQKRLALARALITRPELVLFDEPTAGLDPPGRNAVFEMILRQPAIASSCSKRARSTSRERRPSSPPPTIALCAALATISSPSAPVSTNKP
jgi:phospholipid/cholesterol/gamma-HCH transport system ATP-binding protein